MDPGPRAAFNRAWSPALHRRYREPASGELGPVPFRVAETPFFVTPALRDALTRSALEIVEQLSQPELLAELMRAIPRAVRHPGDGPAPELRPGGLRHHPGAGRWARGQGGRAPGLPLGLRDDDRLRRGLEPASSPRSPASRAAGAASPSRGRPGDASCSRDTILGGEPPEHGGAGRLRARAPEDRPRLRRHPEALRRRVGVPDRAGEGGAPPLPARTDGRLVQVRRIYNRMVFDELEKKGYRLPVRLVRTTLDVTWCSHPNWYWTWSKYALPLPPPPGGPAGAPSSPSSSGLPDDLERYVLKPLFSFAGAGVVIDVTPGGHRAHPGRAARRVAPPGEDQPTRRPSTPRTGPR